MPLKRAKTSVTDYLGSTPAEPPIMKDSEEAITRREKVEPSSSAANDTKIAKKSAATSQSRKNATPQNRNTAEHQKRSTAKRQDTSRNADAETNATEKRRINFRVPHPVHGASPTFDKYTEGEDAQFAIKTIITDAFDQWEEGVLEGAEIPKRPDYPKGTKTYQTTRMISSDVYDKARAVFDPFSKKSDHAIATLIAKAAILSFIENDQQDRK